MPGFYNNPKAIDDLTDHIVGKVLDQFGIEHNIYRRWGENI
jgi:4-hydroxy-3-polyprenylbenzoate decarboxylase